MTDITSAIKMEEEAFQRMKKQSLKKAGTAKPSVKSKHITETTALSAKTLQQEKDLMSFQEVSIFNSDENIDWVDFENGEVGKKNGASSAYSKSIKDVLSLYSTAETNPPSTLPSNQQQPYYPPLGTFANTTYGWQNDVFRGMGTSSSTQNYQAFMPHSNNLLGSHQQYPAHYSAQTFQIGLNSYNTMPTALQHTNSPPTSVAAASQISFSSVGANAMGISTASYGKSDSALSTNYQFPRPSSLGKLNEFEQEKFATQKSPSLVLSASNQRKSFNTTSDLSSPLHESVMVRSSSVGSKLQSQQLNTLQDDRMANIFDEWLNDGWKSSSVTASPQHENLLEKKTTPDWLEWDPLSSASSAKEDKANTDASENATTNKADSGPSAVRKRFPIRSDNNDATVAEKSMDGSVEIDSSTDLERFARSLAELRSNFSCEDLIGNPGHVISPMTDCQQRGGQGPCDLNTEDSTVRISVTADGIKQPVTFECDVNSSVEHIISQALCIAYEDISCVNIHDFYFKVTGREEYLISKSRLALYHYVRECRKFERDIRLELLHQSKVDRSLARTVDDDAKRTVAEEFLQQFNKPDIIMSRDDIQILLEAFYKETEKFLESVQKADITTCEQHFERVTQTVKAMCSALGNVETHEITEKIKTLRDMLKTTTTISNKSFSSGFGSESTLSSQYSASSKYSELREGLEILSSSLIDFTELYCKAYQVNAYFYNASCSTLTEKMRTIPSSTVRELYSVNVMSVHRISKLHEATHDEFFVTCSLWHGDRQLNHSKSTTDYVKITKNFYPKVHFNKWIEFDVSVCELPLETTLRILFYGVQRSDDKITTKKLAWLCIPLFDHQQIMKHKREIFGMWDTSNLPKKSGRFDGPLTSSHNILSSDATVLQLEFSEDRNPSAVVVHSRNHFTMNDKPTSPTSIESLDRKSRNELNSALSHARLVAGPLFNLSQRERDLLWKHRYTIASLNDNGTPAVGLPVLLQCVPHWSPAFTHLQSAYDLLASWPKRLEPEESLALLTSGFPDSRVRSVAISWLEQAEDSEISSWLPQLVQAIRCELEHDSGLARLLLRRAMGSVRICHQLYWLLLDNTADQMHDDRYVVLHAALVTVCGAAMKKEFDKEKYIVNHINRVAKDVKEAKDSNRSLVLNDGLHKVATRVSGGKFRIPTNPAMVASGLSVENSSYFASNAVPLKLAFSNSSTSAPEICIMYKVGDDLRQDALTMQLIRAMDRMWLCEGLDLRMITFDCLPTGLNRGVVEIVSDSRTFREIQSSYGLTGAFKDRPIAEWLQKYNSTGLSYERAVENFTLSCAGYCVATYVLGICDRHNDNIMLRSSGHLFHIDFARFLGHAQMFGNLKRDRAPFVLTSDMAYVINGGDRPSSKFQDFVDVCCMAFNILRKNAHTIINLLSLMVNCGIPELQSKADLKYVYDTLKPNASDTEATTMFTRLIETSLSSSFTRINFFIHNLAQMRFHGGESEAEKRILSFSPQIHPYKEEDGMISIANVVGFQKRYSPEKYYIYCVKVTRERNSTSINSYIFRTFDEFEELHRKLSYNSTLQLPNFPNSVVVGRSQVKQVAERRREKLNTYLKNLLLKSARNVAMHDLVYTFFHPILRDEENESSSVIKSPDLTVGGEIKISLHYKNSALFIMVHHCKNLSPVEGSDPDPYVKTYLQPDPHHSTKRKTKVARKTLHPTYNEMLVYEMTLKEIKARKLFIGVWNFESFQENDFMGSVSIDLADVDLNIETSKWYLLQSAVS